MTRTPLAAALLAAALAGPLAAQAPRVLHTAKPAFVLPVQLAEADRAKLREVRFYSKLAPGGWELKQTAPPSVERFGFTAPQDGEYWFHFVTVDQAGRAGVPDLDRTKPAMVVVVDTVAPEVSVQPMPVASGEVLLQVKLRDRYPDYRSVTLEWRDAAGVFRGLEPVADSPGLFRATDSLALKGFVRAAGSDRAGNRTVREIDLANPNAAQPVAAAAKEPPVEVVPPSARKAEPLLPVAASVAPPEERMALKPAEPPPAPAPKAPARHVNSTHCAMNYAVDGIGPGGLQRVEGYLTRDGGQTWWRFGEDADRKSPFEFDLPGDGEFGIVLVVTAGNQAGLPPTAGDSPDWLVEVDTTAPAVSVVATVADAADGQSPPIKLKWLAQDKNLNPDCVELSYALAMDGPWKPLADRQPAAGELTWTPPKDLTGRVYFRAAATDKAGNAGKATTRDAVTLDAPRPKARVIGINPAAMRP